MAVIRADGVLVYFDPYTDSPKDHFERITKDIFNELHDNVSYRRYVASAEDRSVSKVTKKDLKQFKKGVESDLNRIIERRGVDTLKGFLGFVENADFSVDWEGSKESARAEYEIPERPEEPDFPQKPEPRDIPPAPSPEDSQFQPEFSLLDHIIPSRKRQKREKLEEAFEEAHSEWKEKKEKIESENRDLKKEHEKEIERIKERHGERVDQWKSKVEKVKRKRREAIQEVVEVRERYESGDQEAVEETIRGVLKDSPYPLPISFDELKKVFEGEISTTYKPKSSLLVVDREVPAPEEIPHRKKIKYVKSRDVFKSKDLSKREFKSLYESIPYQFSLRTVYEVFDIDEAQVVDSVVFNGWVTSVNPATGHEETVCTLSLQASRDEIMGLNLSQVDPKAAFKNLKGVSASKLRDKSPVTPIIQADRGDSRFTEGRDVGEEMEEGENIAAMDWENFEHLIRELFESEFEEDGGEVNVTQASRDGGIDAVVFDPDPLRGGKIVIQAKRYTQTVGVSAVRDLYGTVMNEGASRGILVTTSDYGSAAYDFAKDKPLQLLDGGNLLSLLEQHGYNARIDVEEAREKMD